MPMGAVFDTLVHNQYFVIVKSFQPEAWKGAYINVHIYVYLHSIYIICIHLYTM